MVIGLGWRAAILVLLCACVVAQSIDSSDSTDSTDSGSGSAVSSPSTPIMTTSIPVVTMPTGGPQESTTAEPTTDEESGSGSESGSGEEGGNAPPTIEWCPESVSLSALPGQSYTTHNWRWPYIYDNDSLSVLTLSSHEVGSMFPVGASTVMYVASDEQGAISFCTFLVTVLDEEKPWVMCPSFVTIPTDAMAATAGYELYPESQAGDNVGVAWSDFELASDLACEGNVCHFPIGSTQVTYMVADATGNEASCSFDVIVVDYDPPTFISCPTDIWMQADSDSSTALVHWEPAVAIDNSGSAQISGPANSERFNVGATTLTYVAEDAAGNRAMCVFTITISDGTAPVLVCPSSFVRSTDAGQSVTLITASSLAPLAAPSDNVGIASLAAMGSGADVCNVFAGTGTCQFGVGVYTFAYSAIDTSNNVAFCEFNVTIQDNEAPEVTGCPQVVPLVMEPGQSFALATWAEPSFSDNIAVVSVQIVDQDGSPVVHGERLANSVASVSYVATDAAGNEVTCTFVVRVSDSEAPVITNCPASQNVSTDVSQNFATVWWDQIVVTDNVAVSHVELSHESGSTFPIGQTAVSVKAWDDSHNMVQCAFTVSVVDDEMPVIIGCPSNIKQGNNAGKNFAVVVWTSPSVQDNDQATLFLNKEPGTEFEIGIQTVWYMAVDESGNVAQCTFTVQVDDIEAPSFVSGCHNDITVVTAFHENYAVVSWSEPIAADNFDEFVFVNSTHVSGERFLVGDTIVEYTAMDISGNSAQCHWTVHVVDDEAPYFVGCPDDITSSTDVNSTVATVSWVAPQARDNVMVVNVATTHDVNSTFAIGSTLVTYTAVDDAGLTATCSFRVRVADNQAPSFTSCPDNMSLLSMTGESKTASWAAPVASDNVAVASIGCSTTSGSLFAVGSSLVTCIALDTAGNSATCSFAVNVVNTCAGVVCTTSPASCRSSTGCYNGTCGTVQLADNSVCDDSDPRTVVDTCSAGVCKSKTLLASFGSSSYLSLPAFDDVKASGAWQSEVSFDFRTVNNEGMIFSVGDPSRDFMRAYLMDGKLYWTYRLGAGTATISSKSSAVYWNDGQWHRVVLLRRDQAGTMTIDGVSFTGSASGTERKLDVNGPIFVYNVILGAIPRNYRATYTLGGLIPPYVAGAGSESFQGCLQNFRINGVYSTLSDVVYGPEHDDYFDLRYCSTLSIATPSFLGEASYLGLTPLTLTQNANRAFLWSASLSFKTETPNGVLLFNGDSKRRDFISVELQHGIVVAQFDAGAGVASCTIQQPDWGFNDDQWHTVSVNLVDQVATFVVDGIQCVATGPISARTVDVDRSMYIGGIPPLDRSRIVSTVGGQNFQGCMNILTLQGTAFNMTRSTTIIRNVFECGSEVYYHIFSEPIPNSACSAFVGTDPMGDTNVFPSTVESCRPASSTDARTWRYDNDGYYQCRTATNWLSPCLHYVGAR